MVDESNKLSEAQMDSWIKEFTSRDLCDWVCMNLFAKLEKRSPSVAPTANL